MVWFVRYFLVLFTYFIIFFLIKVIYLLLINLQQWSWNLTIKSHICFSCIILCWFFADQGLLWSIYLNTVTSNPFLHRCFSNVGNWCWHLYIFTLMIKKPTSSWHFSSSDIQYWVLVWHFQFAPNQSFNGYVTQSV